MLDSLDAQSCGDMALAGAGPADQHDVVGVFHEVALVKLAHEGFVDLAGRTDDVVAAESAGQRVEVGLAFEMSLPRPTFFALEALPAALSTAREKKLSVEVLRADGSKFYERPSFEDLLSEWRAANSEAVSSNGRVLRKGSAENLESMWEFSIVRQDLARRYGRGRVEVPELYTVMHKRTQTVGRMVDWDGLQKVALGESDWVRLVDPPKPLKNGAIYGTEELTLACKPLVRTVPQPIFHYLCDKAKVMDELIERIAALKSMTMRSFEPVSLDQLYDEEGVLSESAAKS